MRRLGIEAGDEVEWIEDGLSGFRVVRRDPKLKELMKVHDRIMEECGSVFGAGSPDSYLVDFAGTQGFADGNKRTGLASALESSRVGCRQSTAVDLSARGPE